MKKGLDDCHWIEKFKYTITENYILLDDNLKISFSKFTLENHTLSWKNIIQEIPWGDSFRKVPFEIGADILYSFSKPTAQNHLLQIGKLIRKERLAAGLTQNDLAKRSGTTAGYISRLENDKSDIEIHTLQKVVENGLHKKLEVNFL